MVFESRVDYQLQGYSRDGVAVGTVYSDAYFIGPDAVAFAPPGEIKVHPILRFTEGGPILVQPGTSNIRDFIGRRAIAFSVAESARPNP